MPEYAKDIVLDDMPFEVFHPSLALQLDSAASVSNKSLLDLPKESA